MFHPTQSPLQIFSLVPLDRLLPGNGTGTQRQQEDWIFTVYATEKIYRSLRQIFYKFLTHFLALAAFIPVTLPISHFIKTQEDAVFLHVVILTLICTA